MGGSEANMAEAGQGSEDGGIYEDMAGDPVK